MNKKLQEIYKSYAAELGDLTLRKNIIDQRIQELTKLIESLNTLSPHFIEQPKESSDE